MKRVYQWTEDEDDVALDAVTVGISSDTRILKVAGLQFGQRNATIYWPDWSSGAMEAKSAVEGPMPVENALQLAEQVCERHAFRRVVVWLQHRELWDDRWGELAPEPGL
ncbi:hypothetical protein [Devosia sp.]|uniref:hypothetical protein n=1 Tax=Devosia sp. TaxID=1871048 RepID=UPI002737103D|nr:hypothetical protein [Devosia sp.]MDP2779614.1 hypothetical protein [Devosia sp.]